MTKREAMKQKKEEEARKLEEERTEAIEKMKKAENLFVTLEHEGRYALWVNLYCYYPSGELEKIIVKKSWYWDERRYSYRVRLPAEVKFEAIRGITRDSQITNELYRKTYWL